LYGGNTVAKVTAEELVIGGITILALHYLLSAYAEVKLREAKDEQ